MKFKFFIILITFPFVSLAKIQMAITVDDLPVHGKLPPGLTRTDVTKSILETLKSHHVPEVYGFINAARAPQEKEGLEVLKLWVNAGYPLGNHTFSHPHLNKITAEQFNREIEKNEPTLKEIAGLHDWHYFRYPFLDEGDTIEKRESVRGYLKEKKYKIAFVTDEFEDWAWNDPYARCILSQDPKSVEELKKSFLIEAESRFLRDSNLLEALYHRPVRRILLLHIGAFDALMLSSLLKMYQGKGVEFIPLSEAIKDPIYQKDLGLAKGGGGDFEYNDLKSQGLTLEQLGLAPGWKFPGKELEKLCQVQATY